MQRILVVVMMSVLMGCGGGGGGGNGTPGSEDPTPGDGADIIAEIEAAFPFVADQPFEADYWAVRQGSGLLYFWEFKKDGSLLVSIQTDTYDDFTWTGSCTHTGGAIRIQVPDQPPVAATGQLALGGLFIGGLDETSTIVMPQLGLVAAFATSTFVFGIAGHGENAVDLRLAKCPIVNDLAASYEENAIEFGLTGRPFPQLIPGSVFRQRDVVIKIDPGNPRITRATGIYRTVGDTFYATFRVVADFAIFANASGVTLPVPMSQTPPFPDVNVIKGELRDGNSRIVIGQLGNSLSCDLR